MPGLEEILFDLVALDPAERSAALDRLCGDDEELRHEAESLLAVHAEAEARGFLLESPLTLAAMAGGDPDDDPDDDPATDPWLGRRLGPYRLTAHIGFGGMGSVYEAERDDAEFEKRVAVKLIRRGVGGTEILDRFRRERQILAALEHPNIARLLDGGSTEDGAPYLVMEYVEGLPIDRWCEARQAGLELRLRLFIQVCRAVQYAHQRLVVHRDLKPGNILVTGSSGDPAVKLLDFGIAKLLRDESGSAPEGVGALPESLGRNNQATLATHRVLTPAYASPEQHRGDGVTTASDVYSLGVVLFRLLTSELPADRSATGSGTSSSVPSLSRSAAASELAGVPEALRATWPARLRGDLEAIVGKALNEEPAARYASAGELAADLDRHLAQLPVAAREPTITYRAAKLLRRRTGAVVAGAALLAALIAATVVSTNLYLRAEASRAEAELERASAEGVAGFLASVLTAGDPLAGDLGADPTVRSVLDDAAPRISEELAGQPEIAARLLLIVSRAYGILAHHDAASTYAEKALELRTATTSRNPEGVVEALHQLSTVRHRQARYEEMFDLADRAEELLDGLPAEERRSWRAQLDMLRANAYAESGRPIEAEPYHRSALEVFEEGTQDHLWAMQGLGIGLARQRRLEEAGQVLQRTLELGPQVVGRDHPFVAQAYNDLAFVRLRQDRPQEALGLLETSLELFDRIYPSDHPKVAAALDNVGNALTGLGRPEEAISYHERSLEAMVSRYGPDHPYIGTARNNTANAYFAAGRFEEARDGFATAADLYARHLGDEHAWVAIALRLRSRAERELGNHAAAEELARRALAIRREALPADHFDLATSLVEVAALDRAAGDETAAVAKLRQALSILPEDAAEEGREGALRRRALEMLGDPAS